MVTERGHMDRECPIDVVNLGTYEVSFLVAGILVVFQLFLFLSSVGDSSSVPVDVSF